MSDANEILKVSSKKINKLSVFSNFFNEPVLTNILIKTEVLHKIFSDTIIENLDITKLELFHLQYTDSLIELLSGIKKQIETEILIIENEIWMNKIRLNTYSNTPNPTDEFESDRKYHNNTMSVFLSGIFKNLSYEKVDVDINSIQKLSLKYGDDFYREIDSSVFKKDESLPFYKYDIYTIQKRLLGRLNKTNYKVRFVCGYVDGDNYYELYRYFQSDDEFIWDVNNNLFYLVNNLDIDKSKNTYKKTSLKSELELKTLQLEAKLKTIKKIPLDIINVLNDYKGMIDNTSGIIKTFNFDEATNVLKSMLNLKINDI